MFGYIGKLILIDLGKKRQKILPLKNEEIKMYIGGRGLAIKYLYEMTGPNVNPLSPENMLIIMTGPYTSTPGISSGFYNITTKSPLTNMACSSHSGGYFGAALKKSGYDGILIKGKSKKPVYIIIDNGKLSYYDATDLWGLDVYSTTDLLEERFKNVRVAAIGPAGENLVNVASIMNDRHRAAARGGIGAVMGSKNLKAIAVRGSIPIQIADPDTLKQYRNNGIKNIKDQGQLLTKYGTPGALSLWNQFGGLATRNNQEGYFEDAVKISGEIINKKYKIKNKGCFRCPLACSQITSVQTGQYRVEAIEGPELETLVTLGSKCEISDIEAIIKGNDICNRMGLDTISVGTIIAMAMEMYESNIIDNTITNDINLHFGNSSALIKLLEMISYRQGFGDVLAEGATIASKILGAPELAMCVNSLEMPAAEPRATFGMGLSFVTSNRGACHLRSMLYNEELYENKLDRFSSKGKADMLKYKEDLMAILDSFIICKFTQRYANYNADNLANILKAITGIDYNESGLMEAGDRIYNLERLYNTNQRELDQVLPDRFYDQSLSKGAAEGKKIDRKEFIEEIQRYYLTRGWDKKGVPTTKMLKALSICKR